MAAAAKSDAKGDYELPALPWARDALAQKGISEETINFHYGKHHQAYVNNLNAMAKDDASLRGKTIEQLVRTLDTGKALNQAGQIWNHTFYWHSLSPNGGVSPSGDLAKLMDESFGSFDNFKTQFSAEAAGHFGSGWAWLILTADKKLKVVSTHDAGVPIAKNAGAAAGVPLLTCDVWEHAYYIDFRNARPDYIKAWWSCVNWKFASDNLAAALASK